MQSLKPATAPEQRETASNWVQRSRPLIQLVKTLLMAVLVRLLTEFLSRYLWTGSKP